MNFKILTYNLWHGLNGKAFHMAELEPPGRHQRRIEQQLHLLKAASPDLMFFQEANPVPQLSQLFKTRLNLDEAHLVDNAGIKIFGKGFPNKLFSGLVTLARKELKLKRLGSFRLSGPVIGYCSDRFCFQFAEQRYALICQIEHPDLGKILLANIHLHHGVELSPSILNAIAKAIKEGLLTASQKDHFFAKLERGTKRRLSEISLLNQIISQATSCETYSSVIIAGDLNASPFSAVSQAIKSSGYIDTADSKEVEPIYTWIPQENTENHKFNEGFKHPWFLDEITNIKARKMIHQALWDQEFSRRRLDYIFVTPELGRRLVTTQLFGKESEPGNIIGSDHFGICSDFKTN